MKSIISCCLLAIVILLPTGAHAQVAQETRIRFGKVERPGLLADYPYSKGIVENALRARFNKAGFNKQKSDKGFDSYQAAAWPEIAPGQLDVYTRVDGKDNQSTIILLVSKGYDNYVSDATDADISARLKAFLNTLLPEIQAEQLRADIGFQEEVIRKAEKAYKDMDDEGNKLTREKERIEKQIADNAAEKAKRAEILNVENNKLGALKTQVK